MRMIGFIGTGAMGSAIMRGVISAGLVAASDVVCSDHDAAAAKALSEELGVRAVASNAEVVTAVGAGVTILAVKPPVVASVLAEIREAAAAAGTVIASIATGTPIAALAAGLEPSQPIVRVMPNVAAQVGAGVAALCPGAGVTAAQLGAVRAVFEAVGIALEVPEKDFSAFAAIAGCSPAWTFAYIDALSRGALAAGMRKDDSLRIAAQAVLGSAQLALQALDSSIRPQALIDTVTSPGGTTIAGLIAAEREGFSNATVAAVTAAIARDQEIASS